MIRTDHKPWANLVWAKVRWLDGLALGLWAVVAGATMLHHEPWADEASTWLVARDLSWFPMILQLGYESNPGLWHSVVWIAIHWFHAGYSVLGWIGLDCGLAGTGVLIFLAPFPRLLRYLIAFSFYFLYQYAVVARPYNLLPLFAFLGAWLYRKGTAMALPFALTLTFLCCVSVHGVVIALALATGFVWRARREGAFREGFFRTQLWVALLSLCATLAIVAFVVWPPPDSANVDDARRLGLPQHFMKMRAGLSAAFCNINRLSLVIAALLYLWSAVRKVGAIWLIAVVGNALVFGFLRGSPHHLGTMVAGAVTALWCGWPTKAEVVSFSPLELRWNQFATAGLCALFAYQTAWSWSAVRSDWLLPYSGAREAAEYLKSAGADRESIDGFDYNVIAILPYFESNIFANLRPPTGSPFQHSFSRMFRLRSTLNGATELGSKWVVVGIIASAQMQPSEAIVERSGYELAHVAPGTAFSHSDSLSEKQTYLIFKRSH